MMPAFSFGKRKETNESDGDQGRPEEDPAASQPPDGSDEGSGDSGTSKKATDTTTSATTTKSRTKSNRKKTPSGSDTKQVEGTAGRKIVKAIPPPENSGDPYPVDTSNAGNDEKDNDIDRDPKVYAPPGKSPSAEGEAQQKLMEKTRKERQDAVASAKKKIKGKLLEEKRKAPPSDARDVTSGQSKEQGESATTQQPRAKIFSVESEFPEHKRTVEKAALPVDSEPMEKKCKVDTDTDEDDGSSGDDDKAKLWGLGWLIPAAAIVAVAAVVMIKAVRKK